MLSFALGFSPGVCFERIPKIEKCYKYPETSEKFSLYFVLLFCHSLNFQVLALITNLAPLSKGQALLQRISGATPVPNFYQSFIEETPRKNNGKKTLDNPGIKTKICFLYLFKEIGVHLGKFQQFRLVRKLNLSATV